MSKVIEVARKEIGVTEKPKNSNQTKYGTWFSLSGVPWCAIFVSWCYSMAGNQLPVIGFKKGFAGCQTGYAYFKKNGWIVKDPQEGDIVLFDWNGDGRYDHTGLFVRWIDKVHFETIEGNTSLTNQSNGGEVMLRVRANKNVIFARYIVKK
ncbi:MAG: CHAP domain-containing protein [Saprospiraceae bacterium]